MKVFFSNSVSLLFPALSDVPFHLLPNFSSLFLLGFFCFNSREYLLSLESLLGSFLLRMTEALEQANLDMEVCSLVDLYLRTVVLLPCNTQSHMSCSRPLMQLQQPLTSPRGMWRMELSIALLAKVLGGHQLFLLLHCRALRVLEVVTVLLHRTRSLQERPINNFTRLAQLWFHCMPPLK